VVNVQFFCFQPPSNASRGNPPKLQTVRALLPSRGNPPFICSQTMVHRTGRCPRFLFLGSFCFQGLIVWAVHPISLTLIVLRFLGPFFFHCFSFSFCIGIPYLMIKDFDSMSPSTTHAVNLTYFVPNHWFHQSFLKSVFHFDSPPPPSPNPQIVFRVNDSYSEPLPLHNPPLHPPT